MIIICNGAFKSGSTWLFLIIEEILKLKSKNCNETLRKEWQSSKNSAFLFNDGNIKEALPHYLDKNDSFFLTKAHFLSEETYVTLKENCNDELKIFFIERDLGDAIVSHYHHVITQTNKNFSLNKYFNLIGKFKAKEIVSFSLMRKKYLSQGSHSLYFEDLKTDFSNEVIKVASFLGFNLTQEEIVLIQQNTSLSNLKDKAKQGQLTQYSADSEKASKLFRKGIVGEGLKTLSKTQRNQLSNIKNGRTSVFYKLYYLLFFKLRRSIYKM